MGKNFLDKIGKGAKSAGKWTKHAAEDTFHFGKKTIGNVGGRMMDTIDTSVESLTGVLSSPSFFIIAGVAVVVVILVVAK